MKSLQELAEIRKKALDRVDIRTGEAQRKVVVGMATCGIAAGARPVLSAFVEEVSKRGVKDVNVSQTGCVGACRLEPMADVIDADGTKTTYVHLTPDKAKKIVADHLVNGNAVTEYTIGYVENNK